MDEYRRMMQVVETGTLEQLEQLAAEVPGFHATPLEEARHLGKSNAVRYLEGL